MGPRTRGVVFFAIVAVAGALAGAPLADAQQEEACRKPVIEVASGPETWQPGMRFIVLVSVVNENEAPVESVTVRLDVSPPAGWSASLARTTFPLGPASETVNPLTITAPQRGTGLASGEVVITAHFTCHHGDLDARSQSFVSVPVQLEPVRIPWLLVGAVLLALLVGVSAVWAVRARMPRVSIKATTPEKGVPPGRGAQFPLLVGNRRREPDGIVLTLSDVREGWSAHLAVDELELEPREERPLWLMVRAPPNAPNGEEHRITVRAASRKSPRDVAYVEVTARVARNE